MLGDKIPAFLGGKFWFQFIYIKKVEYVLESLLFSSNILISSKVQAMNNLLGRLMQWWWNDYGNDNDITI